MGVYIIRKYETGSVIGELTLLEKTGEKVHNGYTVWSCVCSCGVECERSTHYFASKPKKYCCSDCAKEVQRQSVSTHGMFSNYFRLATIGSEAKARCENKNNTNYHNYGGRGIKFEFKTLDEFVTWSLKNGYRDELSIERVDNNGNYNADNCKWISRSHQAKNKRTTPEFHGYRGLDSIAEYFGITNRALQAMIYKKKMTFQEVYESSQSDPYFHVDMYEKTSIKAKSRKNEWKLSKHDVEDIIKRIDQGETKSYLAKKVYMVDYSTLVKSIKRYNEGLYN